MTIEFTTSYVKESIERARYYKRLGERAMEQIPDDRLFTTLDAESNSIAIIVKHVAGNMRSRWTEFLTTDGEKPDRNRDSEFEAPPASRDELRVLWESSWKLVFDALTPLTERDLSRTIHIGGAPHSVVQAINRNLMHTVYHVGQIVFLAKHYAWPEWNSLTVPRGKSEAELKASRL
jgi:hypothetical protein